MAAGNRWHIDCFRCSTCSTLLDSDAHLLLLGDGSLICSNCTYSCSSCNNKIEDLAILTGDQAFCAQCFRCRNCKRKIENLRYARTSQGIFCMECHESLMARRRKRKAGGTSGKKPAGPNVKLDKSLPSLPPHLLEEAQLMEEENSEYTGTPDPNRMAETPDLNDERPGSSISNQQADSGKKLSLQPRCIIIAAYPLLSIVALWSHYVIYTSLSILHTLLSLPPGFIVVIA